METGNKIGLAALVLAIGSAALSVATPEARCWLGLDSCGPAQAAAQIKPKYDLGGDYNGHSGGKVTVTQSGMLISWKYNTPSVTHNFLGTYTSPDTAKGVQDRVTLSTQCHAQMDIIVKALGPHKFCHESTLSAGSNSCDLPSNWPGETICYND